MGRIRILADHVVNQIAAGEVVDRPASVVKELVENAIDAGATRVDVAIAGGGRDRIEVADDGVGMDSEDLAAAFLPHATSKLREVADLEHIASLGFRGEALASIGAVSRATISSRPRGGASGAFVEDREGEVGPVRPAGAAPGTVVVVEGLFTGVPARRKFLKSAATEAGHVHDLLTKFALAHPDVAFRLACDGRSALVAEEGEGRLERIGHFHGDDLARSLLPVRAEGEISLEAWIGPPSVTRADARLQQTLLNGRAIRDRTVQHAAREAYRDLLPPGNRQAVAFLFLSCDPARVDVNVHPAKAEVRWRDSSLVHETVRRALRAALEGARPGVPLATAAGSAVPATTVEAAEFAFTTGAGRAAFAPRRFPSSGGAGLVHEHAHGLECEHGHAEDRAVAVAPPPRGERLTPLGQAHGTYLLLESDDGLVIVDQHALHERVLFDEISRRLSEGRLEVQRLLVPIVVDVSASDQARLGEERDLLERLGWEVEPFGEGAVAVHACPAVLRRPDPAAVLAEVLGVLEAGRRESLDRAALLSSIVDRMSCRAAVMAGDALDPEEVRALLERAESLNHAHTCPHGRPTRLVLSRRELERYFHRTS
jgi:DNA mismatch repair protein MutL